MKKPSVTIVIPAYNEEKSIYKVLKSLTSQKDSNYYLSDIIVYSDGSTDETVSIIKRNFPRVIVYDYKNNLGKNKRINQIMKRNKSDIVVQVDDDIIVKSNQVVTSLINPIIKNDKVGISCAYHVALPQTTLAGKVAYFGFRFWDKARMMIGRQAIRYYCEGGMRAFSKSFCQVFRLPEDRAVSEDTYSFYFAVQNGYRVEVAKKAKVYMDIPHSFFDYIRQMKRFFTATDNLENKFDTDLINKYEVIKGTLKIKAFLYEFAKTPILGAMYALLQVTIKLQMPFYKSEVKWTPIAR